MKNILNLIVSLYAQLSLCGLCCVLFVCLCRWLLCVRLSLLPSRVGSIQADSFRLPLICVIKTMLGLVSGWLLENLEPLWLIHVCRSGGSTVITRALSQILRFNQIGSSGGSTVVDTDPEPNPAVVYRLQACPKRLTQTPNPKTLNLII